ncbi:MAG: DNA-directed DNA polymerase I [Nitrososphaerota archaeon]
MSIGSMDKNLSDYLSIKEDENIYFLLGSGYDGFKGKAYLKLLDQKKQEIILLYDETNHKPYCYSKNNIEELKGREDLIKAGAINFIQEEKYDPLIDDYIKVTKIVASDPLSIGGRKDSIREIIETWESDIPYHLNYLYDMNLIPGMPYKIENGILKMISSLNEINKMVNEKFNNKNEEEKKEIAKWLLLLEAEQPEIKYVSIDLEVLSPISTRVPNPAKAEYPIISIAFVGSDGLRRVLMLKIKENIENIENKEFTVTFFNNEREMLHEAFNILNKYPCVVTFNGDDFDLPYLRNRAEKLNMSKEEIPIVISKEGASLERGIHIDLYRFFFNKSIQVYAFGNAYRENTLDGVAKSILGRGKIEILKNLSELSIKELAEYNFGDALLVYDLVTINNKLVIKLLIVLSRISMMPIEDVCRHGVSGWIKSLFYYEHRKRNYLIPRPEDIIKEKGVISTKAIIEGKKYRGAIVVQPLPGVHFNVIVLDFASLYPSALKIWNLSYETVRCPHQECKDNLIPETSHWVCKKIKGLQSLIIGCLRDVRVEWYKPKSSDKSLSQEKRVWYDVVQKALKVFLNASYGVFGAEAFPLYCPPVAEGTAAIGRYAFQKAIKKAEEMDIKIIYGDTDSIFLKTQNYETIEKMIKWTKESMGLDLEIDKIYNYVVFSSRKKNYLGVTNKGIVDVKGLTGKKRHVPEFIKKAFNEMLNELKNVKNEKDFEIAKKKIENLIREWYFKLKRGDFALEELAFHIMISRKPEKYMKTTPQHVKAAKKLESKGMDIVAGDIISFVKTKNKEGVEPLQLARKDQIDTEKYIEYLRSTFEQVLDALGIDFNNVVGVTSLESFL